MLFSVSQFAYVGGLFELVMALVLLVISLNSYSIFRLTREDTYKWFSLSFFLIAFSFLGRVAMQFVIYTSSLRSRVSDAVIHAFNHTSASDYLWKYGLFSHRVLMILGLIGIFLIITRSKEKKSWFLLGYLAVLTAIVSVRIEYIFDFTAAVVCLLIFLQFYNNYLDRGSKGSFGVAGAFFIIFLSYVTFIFASFDYSLFVAGKFTQLLGYLTLLTTYVGVLRGGR